MKKIVLLVSLLVLFIINVNVFAGDRYEYRWTDTYVDVEQYDDLSKYTSIPKVKLYKNGVCLNDANISCNINGDWLYYLKDVNTSRVGKYQVWYKASESVYNPGTCNNYKALVTFNVVSIKEDIDFIFLGEFNKEEDMHILNVTAKKDEVDLIKLGLIEVKSKENYIPKVDVTNIKFDTPGIYQGKVYVIDKYGNKHSKEFMVNIIDKVAPNVTLKKDLICIEKSKGFNISDYIIVEDNGVGEIKKELLNIDFNKIDEEQKGIIKVTDSFGNSSIVNVRVKIVDTIKPVITLLKDIVYYDYNVKYTKEEFMQFLLSATDGDKDITSNVEIDISELSIEVGQYPVKYSVKDDDNNYCEAILIVDIRSKVAPIIEVRNITVKVNETINYLDYITIIDESDPNPEVKYDDTAVDLTTKGTYYVKISVTNKSGLSSQNILRVKVEEDISNIPPIKLLAIISLGVILVGVVIYKKKARSNTSELNIE